jgi:tetratricopeptide (TPR) repeat protein
LGIIARLRGEYAQAQRYLQDMQINLQEAGSSLDMGYVLREFGYLNTALGNYPLAKSQFEEGVDISKKWEARPLYLFLITGLGNIARLRGEFEQAERLHEEALAISLEIGERRGAAVCVENLGRLAYDKEAYREAEARFLESLQLYEEMGHRHGQATVLCQLGMVAMSLSAINCDEAERRLGHALTISTEIGATPLILEVLRGFALLWTTCATSQTAQEKTLELLSLILNHKASEQETKDKAARLWDKLAVELPADLVTSAMNRAPSTDVKTIAKEIILQNPV